MKEWIPLLQSLIWPLFLTIILLRFKSNLQDILNIAKKRIESGSEVSIGPKGFSLGRAPKLEETDTTKEYHTINPDSRDLPDNEKAREYGNSTHSKFYYLIHMAEEDFERSARMGRPFYKIRIRLESVDDKLLEKITKVVYRLHPSFSNPNPVITDSRNGFELQIYAWGEFNLSADVFLDFEDRKFTLFRYLDLQQQNIS